MKPVLVVLLAVVRVGSAQVATLVADAHVNSAQPDVNSGAISNLNVGGGYTALLQFDLSLLPAGTTAAQVSRAVLVVYCNRADVPGAVSVAPVAGAWGEYSVTYTSMPPLGSSIATATVGAAGEYVAVDVTGLVQAWVSAPASNHGLALSASAAAVQFDSKENDQTGHAAELELAMATGATGPMGPAGPAGLAGATGATGPAGPVGATGPAGPAGSASAVGATGPQGPVGPQGATGPAGPVGAQGVAGPMGLTGAVGATGPAGVAGPVGPTGLTGAAGPAGLTGPAGAAGPQGVAGAIGPQGPTGATGGIGLTGPMGPQGQTGGSGPQGIAGVAGAVGPQGPMGTPGYTGPAGPTGATGPIGPQGVPGPLGINYRGTWTGGRTITPTMR